MAILVELLHYLLVQFLPLWSCWQKQPAVGKENLYRQFNFYLAPDPRAGVDPVRGLVPHGRVLD